MLTGRAHRQCIAALALLLAGCEPLAEGLRRPESGPARTTSTAPTLAALTAGECRALLIDDAPVASLRQALAQSVAYLEQQPPERLLPALDQTVSVGQMRAALQGLAETAAAAGDLAAHICERLHVYRAAVPDGILVTGYYQPELAASRTRTNRFRYPLYQTPPDLVDVDLSRFCDACRGRVGHGRVQDGRLVPYYTRAEIEAGILAGRDLELAWLDDPLEAFFLHVQGSARLRFPDGVLMQVSYSSANGRPYTSLGRLLMEQGKLQRDEVSLQTIKEYLRAHSEEQAALMARNERYVFFRTVTSGAVGSLGVPLTGGRSLAADATVYPQGALGFIRVAARADGRAAGSFAASRFALLQDAGAAITGAGRLDLFLGTGVTAEAIAGELRNAGELYLVLPR